MASRRRLLIPALIASLSLSGCAAISTALGPAPILKPAAQVTAAKAAYDFEAAYRVAGQVAQAYLTTTPPPPPAAKAKVKAAAAALYSALKAVRAAQDLGDAAGLSARITAFQGLVADLYAAAGQVAPAVAATPAS